MYIGFASIFLNQVKVENGDSMYLRNIVYTSHISMVEGPQGRTVMNEDEPEINKFT
jgi:hypothetical protein